MKLQINGEERSFDDAAPSFTLAALVEVLGVKADLADSRMLKPEVRERAEREAVVVF